MSEAPHYDLVVIGSGPAGTRGAIAAAKLGRNVAIVDRREMAGGVSLHTGTIPSKTLREAILYLTGFRQRAFYGPDYSLKEIITAADLRLRVQPVIEREMAVLSGHLRRNGIRFIEGEAHFVDPHTIEVDGPDGALVVHGDHVLIACGTRPATAAGIPIDGRSILLTDRVGAWDRIPRELIVVGAGVIGLEYASMFTALGIRVTVIDARPTILDFVDPEIMEALMFAMRRMEATFRLGEKVVSVGHDARGRVEVCTASGKTIHGETLLYAVGRQPNTDRLGLAAAGLATDERGRLAVDEHFRTAVPHIYAAGDVIGFPALAATSMEQGRLAGNHMFGAPARMEENLVPFGIYTIPEISMVGRTERALTEERVPYEVGVARFEEVARGQIVGDQSGLLKILFHPGTLAILGVHVIGESAAEIIHIGQAVMALGGTMEYFRDSVFNYPTFAEAYKVAALNGLNKL
jgi:NAD(P) transhydrogenase